MRADLAADTELAPPRWRDLAQDGHAVPLALVCLGVWLHAADSLIVATLLPGIITDLGGAALAPWSVALYELGTIVAGAGSGLAAARLGIRRPMAGAAALFAVGCATAALAPSMQMLLVGRLLQGLGGGGLMAVAFVAIDALFPPRLMPRVMAAVSALWGLSSFLGPLIGGVFVALGSWRAGFAFFGLQALALCLWIAARVRLPRQPSIMAPAGLSGLRLAAIAAAVLLIAGAGINVGLLRSMAMMLAGLTCLALALRLDQRAGAGRMLPAGSFTSLAPVSAALTLVLGFSIATAALVTYGPLLFVRLHGVTALTAGYMLACASVGWTVAAIAVSGARARWDPFWIAAGFLLVCATIPAFAWLVPRGPLWAIAVVAGLEGAGFGLAWTFVLRRATALTPAADTPLLAAALPTVQRLGYALGAAWLGIVANTAGFGQSAAGDALTAQAVFLASLPFGLLGLAATAVFVSPPLRAAR